MFLRLLLTNIGGRINVLHTLKIYVGAGVVKSGSFFIGVQLSFTNDEQQILQSIEPVIESLGNTVVDLKVKTVKKTVHVHLVVYNKQGVTVEDCSEIYKTIYPKLEVMLDKDDINLEVASPGIGRVLKDRREYQIFTDRPVALLLEGDSEWTEGVITEVYPDALVFKQEHELDTISFDTIRKTKLM